MQERQHSGTSTTICISITKYIFPVHSQNKQNSNSVLRIFFSKPRFDTVGRRETDYQRYNGHPKPFIRARKVRQTGVRVLEQADCAEFPKYIYHRYMPCFQIMRPPCSTVEENVQGWGFGGVLQWVCFFFFNTAVILSPSSLFSILQYQSSQCIMFLTIKKKKNQANLTAGCSSTVLDE